jgi:putative ABC transport system permease protein
MGWWQELKFVIRRLNRSRAEKDLEDEIRLHLELEAQEKIAAGMTEREAQLAARRAFGSVTLAREDSQAIWGFSMIETIWQDLRFSLRVLRKNPGFTLTVVVTLALAIGASTAIFSVVNVIVLNPFPYRDPSKIYLVRQTLPKVGIRDQLRASGPEFAELARIQAFEQIAAWESVSRNLTGEDAPERVAAAKVSTDFFSLLGIEPVLGRMIRPEEQGPGGERVLIIGHALWQRRFGGDSAVLGQTVALDDEPYTIIGVMPPSFRFDGAEAWFPFPFDFGQQARSGRALAVLGRLRAGSSPDRAKAELEALARQQEQDFGNTNPEYEGRIFYLQPIGEYYFGPLQKALVILLGAVGLVLAIACANIANLLLARSTTRAHEVAVRQALGASRARLIRQMITESATLALIGGALGLLLAAWGTGALVALAPEGTFPPWVEVRLDGRVLLFSLATTLTTALVFGLWPALRISRPQVQEALKSGAQRASTGYGNRRAQSFLIVAEVGLSLILLVMAGLMIRSFTRLIYVDPGFKAENRLSMRVNRSPAKSEGGKQMGPFFQRLIDQVKTAPGIEGVAVTSHTPLVYTEDWTVTVESDAVPVEARTRNVDTRTVSADYFRVMGIPFIAGESFSDLPDPAPAVIINQALARRYWPDVTALGKQIKLGQVDSKSPWFVVKGVVADSAQGALDTEVKPEIYFALSQMAARYRRMNLIVRTEGDPKALLGLIQQRIAEVDKDQPIYQIQTMEELVAESVGTRRFAMWLLVLFAGLALTLATIGIYGVTSYGVSQRKHEIGIRMALGAGRREVLRLILMQGMTTVFVGLAVGAVGALALTRLMSSLLFGVSSTDPLTFVAIGLLLSGVALLACLLPARRALKVDPMIALRYE